MALPTCECVKGLPIGEQLAAIYCATYTLAAGDVDGPYLLKSANLSDVADPGVARGNISAAESGTNTDITSLGGVLNIGSGGATPTASTYPKVVARPNADQTLTSGGTNDIVAFGAEIIDTAGAFAGNVFTVPANAAGVYQVGIAGLLISGGDSTSIALGVFVNGSDNTLLTFRNVTSGTQETLGNGSCLVSLAAGDFVFMAIRQTAGAAWTILNDPRWGHFYIHRVF